MNLEMFGIHKFFYADSRVLANNCQIELIDNEDYHNYLNDNRNKSSDTCLIRSFSFKCKLDLFAKNILSSENML